MGFLYFIKHIFKLFCLVVAVVLLQTFTVDAAEDITSNMVIAVFLFILFFVTVTTTYDLGGGWFLNEIYLTERGYTLSSGIGVGSTAKEVEAAYPGILGMEDLIWDFVDATNEDLNGLYLTIIDGAVSYVALGPWVLDFTVRNTEPSLLDRLTSNEITIYTWNTTAQSWDAVTAINRAAKGISTVLTISEPEPTEPPEGAPVLWLDFGNGTAATLWGDDTATIYTYEGTFDIQNPKALTHHLTGRFPGLDDYVQRAWDNPALTWETEEKAP